MYEQDRALAVLREADSALRPHDVGEALDKSSAAAYELLQKLVRKGRAVRVSHGRYTAVEEEEAGPLPVLVEHDGRSLEWLAQHPEAVAEALVRSKGTLTLAAADLKVSRAKLQRFVEEVNEGAELFAEVNAAMANAVKYQALSRALDRNDGATLRQILRSAEAAAARSQGSEYATVNLTITTSWGGSSTSTFEAPTEKVEELPRKIEISHPREPSAYGP